MWEDLKVFLKKNDEKGVLSLIMCQLCNSAVCKRQSEVCIVGRENVKKALKRSIGNKV